MQPGDTCYVRGGTYREWVKPARGGLSESQRIVYRAYPGEKTVIKGSERIANWVKENGNVWRADVPDAFFGSYNPYTVNISGPYLEFGGENHVGEVYLNGESYNEKTTQAAVENTVKSWFTSHNGSTTQIWVNFGSANPNTDLAELNVRECIFAPTALRLNYITIEGFTMQQAACNWVANLNTQRALVLTMAGHHWVIQNCHITDAKCAGISAAQQSASTTDITVLGHHLVYHNLIERCGESGISGMYGWSMSVIEGNIIQDINYKKQFGGYESGGIKFHFTTDLLIKDNIFRRIRRGSTGNAPGIWADYSCQGLRVTGNVFYDIDLWAILLEMNHGVNLVDNNIFIGQPITTCSERITLAHNLFINSGTYPFPGMIAGRRSWYFTPHTLTSIGQTAPETNMGDRYYNNIFAVKGPGTPSNTNDYKADYNVYYQGAAKTVGDAHSIVNSTFDAGYTHADDSTGVTIGFSLNDAPVTVACPLITRDFIGVYSVVNQGIEDRDGKPITIDRDMLGKVRNTTHPVVGPIENLKAGSNSFHFIAGPAGNDSTPILPPLRQPSHCIGGQDPGIFTCNGKRISSVGVVSAESFRHLNATLPNGIYIVNQRRIVIINR